MSEKKKVIIDGDGGGDEMQLASVLLAHPEEAEVLGMTATFGNVAHDQVFQNNRNIMHFLQRADIPCYPGATGPTHGSEKAKDGAHGLNGLGGVKLEESSAPHETKQSVDFILETLRNNPPGTISITASGPLTNIAQAWAQDPDTMRKVKEIVIMGGCMEDLDAHDVPKRRGNITHQAEFNFQQAPEDAETVMKSGLPITLLPMNCTQQLSFTEERKRKITTAFAGRDKVRKALLGMMDAANVLDRQKFGSATFMHDVHCALYLLHPEEYTTQKGQVEVCMTDDPSDWDRNPHGRTDFSADETSTVAVATAIKDPQKLFGTISDSLQTCLAPKPIRKQQPVKTPNIMVVGSSVMDLITYLKEFPEAGQTVIGESFESGFGGKGANQAVAAKLIGANVSMVSCVGDDPFGRDTIGNFNKRGIDASCVQTIEGESTGTAPIFVDTGEGKKGQNRIVVTLGANTKISPQTVDDAVQKLPKPDSIIMQCEMPLDTIYHTTEYARNNGIVSILNVAPAAPVDLTKLDGLDYLVVNESEATAVSGMPVKAEPQNPEDRSACAEAAEQTKQNAIAAAKKILESSAIRNVIVTLGENGVALINRQKVTHKEPFAVHAIDTAGAGDAWLGCFASSLAQGNNEDESMLRANLFAGLSTEKRGTQKSYPSAAEFQQQIGSRILPRVTDRNS